MYGTLSRRCKVCRAASILRAQIPYSVNTKDTDGSRHELCSNRYQLPSACRAVIDGVGSVGTAILGVGFSGSCSFICRIRLILHLIDNLQLGLGSICLNLSL